ncbi:MAG: DUF2726 domain-containing protein [Syntrophomonadaceae bacterium]|nr:DUF2726 domain-containing protein [Syntrophomonadaceae bacterium]MDD3889373.1 DUF2726 domain-containing protein [Syntrophomonadaceae bacterium]MDD4548574.1 DUF2726 domain-containing protein [Syntrophomonadaceae bacterium]
MLQAILLVTLIVAAKLMWDIYRDYKGEFKKSKPQRGKVIDLRNAWIKPHDMPYKKREHLLTGRELALYQILSDVIDNNRYVIFPKVRLADLLVLPADTKDRHEYISRINERHVDFVICEREGVKPVLAVLREAGAKKKKISDKFTKQAAESAGLKTIVVNMSNIPSAEVLSQYLSEHGIAVVQYN